MTLTKTKLRRIWFWVNPFTYLFLFYFVLLVSVQATLFAIGVAFCILHRLTNGLPVKRAIKGIYVMTLGAEFE